MQSKPHQPRHTPAANPPRGFSAPKNAPLPPLPKLFQPLEVLSESMVLKRLRIMGDSNVDPSQPSMHRLAQALFDCSQTSHNNNDDEILQKKEHALKELARFEFGPIRQCRQIISVCERETEYYSQHLQVLQNDTVQASAHTKDLKEELIHAKALPKDAVEKAAQECLTFESQPTSQLKLHDLHESLSALREKRALLEDMLAARKAKLQEITSSLLNFKAESLVVKL